MPKDRSIRNFTSPLARALILEACRTDDAVRAFAFDRYPELRQRVSSGTSPNEVITILLALDSLDVIMGYLQRDYPEDYIRAVTKLLLSASPAELPKAGMAIQRSQPAVGVAPLPRYAAIFLLCTLLLFSGGLGRELQDRSRQLEAVKGLVKCTADLIEKKVNAYQPGAEFCNTCIAEITHGLRTAGASEKQYSAFIRNIGVMPLCLESSDTKYSELLRNIVNSCHDLHNHDIESCIMMSQLYQRGFHKAEIDALLVSLNRGSPFDMDEHLCQKAENSSFSDALCFRRNLRQLQSRSRPEREIALKWMRERCGSYLHRSEFGSVVASNACYYLGEHLLGSSASGDEANLALVREPYKTACEIASTRPADCPRQIGQRLLQPRCDDSGRIACIALAKNYVRGLSFDKVSCGDLQHALALIQRARDLKLPVDTMDDSWAQDNSWRIEAEHKGRADCKAAPLPQ